jgi:hypothetical protein
LSVAAWVERALAAALREETPRPSSAGRQAKSEAVATERDPGLASRQGASRLAAPQRTSASRDGYALARQAKLNEAKVASRPRR